MQQATDTPCSNAAGRRPRAPRHRLHRVGREVVPGRLHLRGDRRGDRRARRARQRRIARGGEPDVRQRLLEPHHLHHADGVRRDRRLRRRHIAARGAPDPRARRACRRPASVQSGSSPPSSILASLLNWGLSLIFGGLLVRALAQRAELRMDYRAAAAAAYLGLGATWAMGLSSSAAQLQANPAQPAEVAAADHGRDPVLRDDLPVAVGGGDARPARRFGAHRHLVRARARHGGDGAGDGHRSREGRRNQGGAAEAARRVAGALAAAHGAARRCSRRAGCTSSSRAKHWMIAISSLNTYNFIFIMLGLLLHWRPKRFLAAVAKAVPATGGVLIQFPFYGAIAAILTQAKNAAGLSVSDQIAHFFVSISTQGLYPAGDRRLFGDPRLLHSLRRRQVAARGALRHAGGERPAGASRVGGAGLQRRRGAAEPHQPVLDAAAARRARSDARATSSASPSSSCSCTCRWCCSCSGRSPSRSSTTRRWSRERVQPHRSLLTITHRGVT